MSVNETTRFPTKNNCCTPRANSSNVLSVNFCKVNCLMRARSAVGSGKIMGGLRDSGIMITMLEFLFKRVMALSSILSR